MPCRKIFSTFLTPKLTFAAVRAIQGLKSIGPLEKKTLIWPIVCFTRININFRTPRISDTVTVIAEPMFVYKDSLEIEYYLPDDDSMLTNRCFCNSLLNSTLFLVSSHAVMK